MSKPQSASAIAEDTALAAQIAKANYFTAFMRFGPNDKIRSDPLPNYNTAREVADSYEGQSRFGRKALVYAVNDLGSFPVDERMARLAGLI